MTDWQMLVEKWDGRAQLPEVHRDDNQPQGPQRLHDDAEVPARVARPVHVRGPRDAVEHRRPQPRRQHRQPAEVPRHRDLHRRHGRDPELRADVGEHESALRHRRAAHPSRSHRPRHRRREDRRARRCRHRRTGPSRPTRSSRASSFRACASSSSRTRNGSSPATATSPACSICSRAGRDLDRHVRERVARRQRLPLPDRSTARCAGRRHAFEVTRRRRAVLRRRRALRLLDQAARRRGRSRPPRSTPTLTGSTSAQFTDFQELPGLRVRRRGQRRRTLLEWPLGPLRRPSRRADGCVVTPPPGVKTMTASLAPRGPADAGPRAARVGAVRAVPAADAPADRRPS